VLTEAVQTRQGLGPPVRVQTDFTCNQSHSTLLTLTSTPRLGVQIWAWWLQALMIGVWNLHTFVTTTPVLTWKTHESKQLTLLISLKCLTHQRAPDLVHHVLYQATDCIPIPLRIELLTMDVQSSLCQVISTVSQFTNERWMCIESGNRMLFP